VVVEPIAEANRRERIGFVFQAYNLLPRATALHNVELPLIYQGVAREERRSRAREALTAVGLGDRLDHHPMQLSGGQQQRVAIARALVTRPDVVLADEPTGNLDSHSEQEILDMLNAVHADGATLVMVTHAREVAERGTRIVHMLDGEVDLDEALGAARAAV
jgi:putative ABC transport system ATP-binding protein